MKRMKQRILSMLLAVVMVLCMLPTTAFASEAAIDTTSAATTDAGDDISVDVTFTVSQGSVYYYAEESETYIMDKELTVPYFDLALYGLENYYYNPDCYTGEEQTAGTKETAEGHVTIMHLFLYATEIYKCGLAPEEAGLGYLQEEGLMGDLIGWSGLAGSSFMTMWNLGYNLNYYLNYSYPLGKEGWGSTCDQILLEDGDTVDLHAIKSPTAYGSNFAYFTADDVRDNATVEKGASVELTLWHTQSDWTDYITKYVVAAGETVYYTSADAKELEGDPECWTELGDTDENGKITLSTEDLAPGTYYVGASGYDDTSAGVEQAPALFTLVVEGEPEVQTEDVTMTTAGVIPINKDYIGTATVKGAAINNVKKVITDDGSLQYIVELSVHTPDDATISVDLTQTGVSGAGYGYAIKNTLVSSVGWDGNDLAYEIALSDGKGSMNAYSYYGSTSYTPLTISFYKGTTGEVYIEPTEITTNDTNGGTFNGKVSQIVVTNQNVAEYSWLDTWVLEIVLDKNVADDATVNLKFVVSGSLSLGLSNPYDVQLVDGQATVTLTAKGTPFGASPRTFTIYLSNKVNEAPVLKEGVESAVTAETTANVPYELDLASIFEDPEEGELTYSVSINGADPVAAEEAYSYVQSLGGIYTLVFTANDGKKTSDTYTVTLAVKNSETTYDVAVTVPEGTAPEFYITTGMNSNGYDIYGETLTTTVEGNVYTVAVPENISQISYRADGMGMSLAVSAENNTVSLRKVVVNPVTPTDAELTADDVTVKVTSDGYQIAGNGLSYLLAVDKTYTYEVTPGSAISGTYAKATLADQMVEASEDALAVTVTLNFSAPKQITADSDAKVQMFYQSKYYVLTELKPVLVEDNEDGTTTYTYNDTRSNGYGSGFSYRVSKEGCITKAGYYPNGTTNPVITWEGEEDTPTTRKAYDTSTTYGTRGDDSILVNVNSRNHLVLEEGETFRMRAFRIWEIIDSDTTNVMIEPDFHYTGYDKEMLTIVSANEKLTGQVSGNAVDNWVDITANKTGTTFLEVSYDALKIVTGYEAGSWGGAYGQPSNYTYNACDPNRTALVVVQVGNAATDVSFGIDCLSSNVSSDYYDASNAVAWDAEFDTLYFTGDSDILTFAPTVGSGAIKEVSVSSDKGETWKVLECDENGVYEAEIFAGNNVICVKKEDDTTAYQVVRGDKVTVTVDNHTNPGEPLKPGDTAYVIFEGLHYPVGKMSGIYNPGYGNGHRITYTFNGENLRAANYQQYSFIANSYIEVTIPEDADHSTYTMTDGYISFNIMGNGPGSHRGLSDSGASVNTSASSSKYTRCILPEVTLEVEIPFQIITQPTDASAIQGENATVSVEAIGENLTYQWYYKNPGNKKFYASGEQFVSEDGTTYSIPMYAWRDGQQVYCVITNAKGETLTTNIVTLTLSTGGITIVSQPQSTDAAVGEMATVTVEATGEGLTYTWYYKNPGNVKFYVSGDQFVSEDGTTYSIPMYSWRDGQQVYCVITDAEGAIAQTETVTLTMSK